MRAVVYGRVSTDLQSETSVNEQIRRTKQYVEMKGWTLVDEFTDVGTGMNTDRAGFEEMMNRIDEWDVVIAFKLDRFHRSSTNAQTWAAQLNSIGKNFVALDIDVDTTSAMGMAVFRIITALNQMEVEVTQERTRIGLQGVKNEGRWVGKPPYGYDSIYAGSGDDKDKGLLEINQGEAEVVQMVFLLRDQGTSLTGIAEALSTAGILTKSKKTRWSTATIGDMIKRRIFYEGHYYNTDNNIQEFSWPSILEED
jgi:site-specific DNA recombinase